MTHFIEQFLLAWIPLFVALNPPGKVPMFLGMTQHVDSARRRRLAHQAIATAALVAVGFMFLGSLVFRALSITVADFQIAGGLILLILASRDLVGGREAHPATGEDLGVVPLGMPLIAGPATLTALLHLQQTVGVLITLLALAVNLALVYVACRYSEALTAWIGKAALRAVAKIVALLLAAIAVHMIRQGFKTG
jgi:multiple antibiotic resistance protein